jgi:hypothetical protein
MHFRRWQLADGSWLLAVGSWQLAREAVGIRQLARLSVDNVWQLESGPDNKKASF